MTILDGKKIGVLAKNIRALTGNLPNFYISDEDYLKHVGDGLRFKIDIVSGDVYTAAFVFPSQDVQQDVICMLLPLNDYLLSEEKNIHAETLRKQAKQLEKLADELDAKERRQ
jgi:hypothetical protein